MQELSSLGRSAVDWYALLQAESHVWTDLREKLWEYGYVVLDSTRARLIAKNMDQFCQNTSRLVHPHPGSWIEATGSNDIWQRYETDGG
ncbi:hypothetical protein KQX54_006468 [Cotesia glomerata]|uniref:Uncharacterized protein n=1 Tax=Cotesia glomerata TaxID=32391 RepID=A0AAV7I201_COTGL|nr:hypothetical protein KQX54_006468 [Cotesia glomerata]